MKSRLTMIGVFSLIILGFAIFAAPAFAASVHGITEVVSNNNSSGHLFFGTTIGLFGAAVGLV